MPTLDAFNSSAFSMTSLSAAVMKAPYKPRLLGSLGLFQEVPVRTTEVFIEEKQGTLSILNTANRGTVQDTRREDTRQAVGFRVHHVPYFQTILADDIQNIRAFGSETELEGIASYVNDQLESMRDDHEVTHEFHRLGALKGIIYDGDNSTVIYNLFTQFGVSQTTHSWRTTDSSFVDSCSDIQRSIANKMGNTPYGMIVAICGNDYFDAVVSHTSTRAAYDRWRDGEWLRMSHLGPEWYSLATNGFQFQNIFFVNYRGTIGNVTFVADDKAYYAPTGVRGLFQEIIAPADFMETVNTRGQRLYAKQERMAFDKGVKLNTQSNVLAMCTRPAVVVESSWAAS